jgi:hypothetical protein
MRGSLARARPAPVAFAVDEIYEGIRLDSDS